MQKFKTRVDFGEGCSTSGELPLFEGTCEEFSSAIPNIVGAIRMSKLDEPFGLFSESFTGTITVLHYPNWAIAAYNGNTPRGAVSSTHYRKTIRKIYP